MGRRRLARDGEGCAQVAWVAFRCASTRLYDRESAGIIGILSDRSIFRLASALFCRRRSGIARALHPDEGQGIRSLGKDTPQRMERPLACNSLELEAVFLSRIVSDLHGFLRTRHAG